MDLWLELQGRKHVEGIYFLNVFFYYKWCVPGIMLSLSLA